MSEDSLFRTPKNWDGLKLSKGYISDYKAFTVVDGEGVRCSLYVSGCLFACQDCFNKATWSFRNGIPYTEELEEKIMSDLALPHVQGLTLLGGEPFLNTPTLIPLVRRIRNELPEKDIWSWSGYTFEQLLKDSDDKKELLSLIDVLVDGPFMKTLKTFQGSFTGSSNQRVLNVKESLEKGEAVLWIPNFSFKDDDLLGKENKTRALY